MVMISYNLGSSIHAPVCTCRRLQPFLCTHTSVAIQTPSPNKYIEHTLPHTLTLTVAVSISRSDGGVENAPELRILSVSARPAERRA